jgi:hypothetical protein
MRTLRLLLAGVLMAVVVSALLPTTSQAVPVFARKYGFSCTMCHSNFPRLNDYGVRYRENGYRLPGRENEEKTVLETPAPFAMRASGGFTWESVEDGPDSLTTQQFRMEGLDIVSAGLIGRQMGYMLVYPPEIAQVRGGAGQRGTLEMASVVMNDVVPRWLNVRVGRFEPAYVAVSVKRQLSAAPYEIYDYTFPGGVLISDTQTGIELSGGGCCGVRYAAGWVGGSPSNPTDELAGDAYARITKVFSAGEGQTAGQRIGVVGYLGAAPGPGGDREEGSSGESFMRYGADVSLNIPHWNLAAQYLAAKDDGALWGAASDVDYWGGFAELSWLPMTRFVGFARYDFVSSPESIDRDIVRYTVGGRYYMEDNIALHAEYSQRTEAVADPGADVVMNAAVGRIDFAF